MRRWWKYSWRLACWLAILLAIAARIRAFSTFDRLSYATGKLVAPPTPTAPEGATAWWSFHLRTAWVVNMGGDLSLGLDHYESLGPEGDALAAQWAGSLGYQRQSYELSGSGPPRPWFAWAWPGHLRILGAGYESQMRQGIETRAIVVPLWMIALGALCPLLIARLRGRARARRVALGHCPSCGYDRSGVGAGRPCPECGRR